MLNGGVGSKLPQIGLAVTNCGRRWLWPSDETRSTLEPRGWVAGLSTMESHSFPAVGSIVEMDELDWRQLYMKIGGQNI